MAEGHSFRRDLDLDRAENMTVCTIICEVQQTVYRLLPRIRLYWFMYTWPAKATAFPPWHVPMMGSVVDAEQRQ